MDEPLLVALPDDALLAVLAYLLPRQLLKCRQVNRRFSNLCLHPDLWRRVRLDVRAVDDLIVWRAALRLAPCLRELDLGPHVYLEDAVTALYRTTCVIAKLGLVLVFDQDVARAAAVVRRQSSLGGLGALRLRFVQRVPNINPLFVAVCCLNNPYDLEIENTSHVPLLAPVCELAGSPSLKKLYYISSTKDTLLEALLKRHATTLEQLHLDIRHPLVPVSSLKALPKLRSLRLAHNIEEDLSELKALPSLNFTLDVN